MNDPHLSAHYGRKARTLSHLSKHSLWLPPWLKPQRVHSEQGTDLALTMALCVYYRTGAAWYTPHSACFETRAKLNPTTFCVCVPPQNACCSIPVAPMRAQLSGFLGMKRWAGSQAEIIVNQFNKPELLVTEGSAYILVVGIIGAVPRRG
jgi:hypothetical protein